MKYLISLLVGLIFGVALFALALLFNPFVGRQELSPLSVSDDEVAILSYSAVSTDLLLYTSDADSITQLHPAEAADLWEPAIRDSELLIASLTNGRGMPAGIGVKISTSAESTRVLHSEAIANSVWFVYMPDRGAVVVYQQENYWAYIRDIVIPAWRSSSDSWKGVWSRNMTSGPGALGTARVIGLSGQFAGLESVAVESLNARAYSMQQGPVSITGSLSIEIPNAESSPDVAAAQQ